MKLNRFFPLKFTAFIGVFLLAVIIWFFGITLSAHAAAGTNGRLTITSINLPLSGGGNPIVGPGRSFDVTFELCNTTGSNQFITVNGAISAGGSAGSASYLTNAGVCDLHTLNFTSPDISFNSCSPGSGINAFNIAISTVGDFGSDGPTTIQFYAELGLTVRNNRSTPINVVITGTNFGGATGQSFTVSSNQSNGPIYVWDVDCGVHTTAIVTITIDGVETMSGSDDVKNGCRYQIIIIVDPTPPPPPPDLCPNIAGNQATIPPGMIIDGSGNCVTPPPGFVCGNNIVEPPNEQCDPPNGTTCDASCHIISPPPPPPGPISVVLNANGVRPTLTIPAAGNVTLSWVTTGDPVACVASVGWSGSKDPASGSTHTDPPIFVSADTTFTIECLALDISAPHVFGTVNVTISSGPPPPPPPPPTEICGDFIDNNGNGAVDEGCINTSGQLSYVQNCTPGGTTTIDIYYPPYDPAVYASHTVILYTGSSSAGPWNLVTQWDRSTLFDHFYPSIVPFAYYRILAVRIYNSAFGGLTFVDNAFFQGIDCTRVPLPSPSPLPSSPPSPPPVPTEICGNGIDDDGDGLIDEGCPLPPAPPQAGTNTTVQFCKAYGDIVGFVSYYSFGGTVPSGGLNFMQISEGSVGNLKATLDPWPASLVKISGPGYFTSGVTYYFRGYYLGAGGFPNLIDSNAYVITPDYATMPICPGTPASAPPTDLEIIAAGMVDPATGTPKTIFNPGEAARATYTVRNPGPVSVSTVVGFWPTGATGTSGSGALPNCPASWGIPASGPGIDPISQTFPVGDTNVTFNFTAPTAFDIYFAHAYVSYGCLPDEGPVAGNVPWGNNDVAITYRVGGDPWFETIGGDVGAFGSITVGGVAVAPAFTSEYLLAGTSLGSNATTKSWKLNNYNKPQVAQDVYAYVSGKLKERAKSDDVPRRGCNLTPGNFSGFKYCDHDVVWDRPVPNGPQGTPAVFFIDGDLRIQSDLQVAGSDTIVFVVKGDIIVNTDVNIADGLYITGGGFTDVDSSGNTGSTLNIDGAIYATGDVSLPRTLADSGNSTLPADIVNFQPKYIQALNDLFGSSTITWQEVAP